MRPSAAYLLPLTTLAVMLTVVACGPNKDYVPVKVLPGTPIAQAFSSCADEIRPSKARVIDAPVAVCEVGKDGLYGMVNHTYRYSVQTASSKLQLSINPDLEYVTEVGKDIDAQVKSILTYVCLPEIDAIFERSLKMNGVTIDMSFNVNMTDSSSSTDAPLIEFAAGTGSDGALVISTRPDGAQLYPTGHKADKDKCNAISDPNAKRACLRAAVVSANQPFCAQMAVMTGHWLGLKLPKGADAHCKETAAADDAGLGSGSAKPTPPKPETDSVYMKGASQMSPKDFFEKASLSRADLKTIFSPACSSFRNLPDEKPVAQK